MEAQTLMFGVGVTPELLPNCQGYLIHLENRTDQVLRVDLDFSGCVNLLPVTAPLAPGLRFDGPVAVVAVPPQAPPDQPQPPHLAIRLAPVDATQPIELHIAGAPSSETLTTTLDCGVDMATRALRGGAGYEIIFTSLLEEAMTLEFVFTLLENTALQANGTTSLVENVASVSVPPRARSWPFVTLSVVESGKPFGVEYALTAFHSKDADPAPCRSVLKCGAVLVVHPLPRAGGYRFAFANPTARPFVLAVDAAESDNLAVEVCPSAAKGVAAHGMAVSVSLEAGQAEADAFCLRSVDAERGVQMNFTLRVTVDGDFDDDLILPPPSAPAPPASRGSLKSGGSAASLVSSRLGSVPPPGMPAGKAAAARPPPKPALGGKPAAGVKPSERTAAPPKK